MRYLPCLLLVACFDRATLDADLDLGRDSAQGTLTYNAVTRDDLDGCASARACVDSLRAALAKLREEATAKGATVGTVSARDNAGLLDIAVTYQSRLGAFDPHVGELLFVAFDLSTAPGKKGKPALLVGWTQSPALAVSLSGGKHRYIQGVGRDDGKPFSGYLVEKGKVHLHVEKQPLDDAGQVVPPRPWFAEVPGFTDAARSAGLLAP
ncbi:MAG: hypothetical protein FJ102_18650 [Deltaproteobacteria bacterium]|nr:hypothetical protein [Deltaproteobacteria bacterium]